MSEPKFTISAIYKDYPLTVEVTGTANQLDAIIDRLRQLGATPPPASEQLIGTTRAAQSQRNDVPVCRIHHAEMRPGKKGGYYCPRKLANGGYCEEKARAA